MSRRRETAPVEAAGNNGEEQQPLTPEGWAELLEARPSRTKDGEWTARCPAHDDRNPSLSIATGTDGATLLHCHAGCATEAIVETVGRTMRDLAPPIRTYDYCAEDGTLLRQVVRFPATASKPKDFRQRRPDGNGGWVWKVTDVRPVPYRLPEVLGRGPDTPVFLVEGEKDADTLVALGLVATTNVGGAGKWTDDLTPHFRGADVVLLPDNDDPGRAHMAAVARALSGTARSVKVLPLPNLPDKGGDVSDWVASGGTLKALQRLVTAAPVWTPEADGPDTPLVRTLREVLDSPDFGNTPVAVAARFAWRGRVTLLVGREKMGKSTLAARIAASVSAGTPLFGAEALEPAPVLWCALEGHVDDVAVHLVAFEADPERVFLLDRLPARLDSLLTAVHQVGPALVVVDTLASYAEGAVKDISDSQGWTRVMNDLGKLARDINAAVLITHHARKSDGKYRDSTAIGAGADVILEMVTEEADPTLRTFQPQARWTVPGFSIRLTGEDAYTLVRSDETTPEQQALRFVQSHPGCSLSKLRAALTGRSAAKDELIGRLVDAGLMTRDGAAKGRAYTLTPAGASRASAGRMERM